MPTSDPVIIARNRLALAHQRKLPLDVIANAKRDLTAAHAERAIRKALAEAPPLLPEQREHLAALILGGAR